MKTATPRTLLALKVITGVLTVAVVVTAGWVVSELDRGDGTVAAPPATTATTQAPSATTLPPDTSLPPVTSTSTTSPPTTTTLPPATTTTTAPPTTTVPPTTTTTQAPHDARVDVTALCVDGPVVAVRVVNPDPVPVDLAFGDVDVTVPQGVHTYLTARPDAEIPHLDVADDLPSCSWASTRDVTVVFHGDAAPALRDRLAALGYRVVDAEHTGEAPRIVAAASLYDHASNLRLLTGYPLDTSSRDGTVIDVYLP